MEVYLVFMLNSIKSLFFAVFFCFLSFARFPEQVFGVENRKQMIENSSDIWQYQPLFKERHNLSVSLGAGTSNWRKESPDGKGEFSGVLVGPKVSYAYHWALFEKLGCLLGSSLAYWVEKSNLATVFEPNYHVELPGVSVGIVYHPSPRARFILKLGAHFERHSEILLSISGQAEEKSQRTIGITMTTWRDFSLTFDYFVTFNWALHFTGSVKLASFEKPEGNVEKTALDLSLTRQDVTFGLGLAYHAR